MVRRAARIVAYLIGALAALVVVSMPVLYIASRDVPRPSGERIDKLAVVGAHVVDVVGGALRRNQTVLISDGRIVDLRSGEPPADYVLFDADGRYVIPGLWNLHVHLSARMTQHFDAPAMVANGTFYVRDMASDCSGDCTFTRRIDEMRALARSFENGDLLGPHIMALSSWIVRGPRGSGDTPPEPPYRAPQTAEDGHLVARQLKERAVDFIKVYNSLPRDAYLGIAQEAQALGLDFAGHIPKSISLANAIAAGQRTVEHARHPLIDCSPAGEEFRSAYEAWAIGASDEPPRLGEYYRAIVEEHDAEACEALLERWAASGAYYVPTHLTRLAEALAPERSYLTDVRARYVPATAIDIGWEPQARSYEQWFQERPDIRDAYMAFFEHGVALTGRAHARGVKIMAGTDTSDLLIYPGFSLHDELGLLVDAGLTPADALGAATVVPAEFFGLEATHGSIDVGKAGELILLAANPLDDIDNTRKIEAIYFNRRLYDRPALDAVLDDIAWKASGPGHYLTIGWFVVTRLIPYVVMHGVP